MQRNCPYCESDALDEVFYDDQVSVGRTLVLVEGLRKLHCVKCGCESVPLDFFGQNAERVEAATMSTAAAVSKGLLRRLRECWGVSQRQASMIFGAGPSAFAKWESGQSRLSTPSALLVQCATKFPQVMEYLARLAHVPLATQASLPFHGPSSPHLFAALENVDQPTPTRLHLVLERSPPARNEPRYLNPAPPEWSTKVDWMYRDGAYVPKEAA